MGRKREERVGKNMNKREPQEENEEKFALDDERRVKVLSPSALVTKRFFSNRLALIGLVIIIVMFLFSFIGGLVMPYRESQVFMNYELIVRDYVNAAYSDTVFTTPVDGFDLPVIARGTLVSAIRNGQSSFRADNIDYFIRTLGDESWLIDAHTPVASVMRNGARAIWTFPQSGGAVSEDVQRETIQAIDSALTEFTYGGRSFVITQNARRYTLSVSREVVLASPLIIAPLESGFKTDYNLQRAFEEALSLGSVQFAGYQIRQESGSYYVSLNGVDKFSASRLSIQPATPDAIIPAQLRTIIADAINTGTGEFVFNNNTYLVSGLDGQYSVKTEQATQLVSLYEAPSPSHWLGTDGAGMDVVTRLMYGGRVSLLIGFVVILIQTFIGVVLGGISGYFGKIIDMLIMRIVDIINCIPTLPLYIILGVFMDGNKVDVNIRIYILMLIMGFMSWPGLARVVRGQILSLREQEFMVAAEALGLRTSRRIFRHLVPNVVPQLIVIDTMGLGEVILAESVLSFLGLGVKFPLASWGTILNSVNDIHVMTNYLSVWIPAGFCILITVLGFNFIGDGLRDAFDPKMKR
jgi:peptide/nickel transport system permease protein